ncbi:hypothetical protein BOTBODRAFT_335068 [Botryobasidium botryosum FD-172 SS1]|uniref:Fungal lipase-type domain-containing protein n=1 Tax=Botryobasidium botryosum (strain FD-172 SS1) TaxID=930990 RepID=A0A067M157_BOTB1|nr:hypothetical protein BOTBODRAFT_335068 [Botryobasidium botryosum FD-172 SS1]
MHKAVDAARRGEFDRAVNYIKEAQEYVDVVARALDCTFVQLCDFTKRYPDGTWLHNGAYCGAFISNSTAKPFIGMAFKGTNSTRELVTDLDWTPLKPDQPGVAFDSKTHRGFYLGLFGRYKNASGGPDVPFELMIKQLDLVYNEHQRSVLHFTGYSLGGAYCTLTYGEFLRRTLRYTFGDMYSLAAPRVCELPFATEVFNRTKPGNGKYIFRIVYRKDPVPTVPPRTKSQLGQYRFTHVDGGWQLFPSEGPKVMRSERPPNNPVDPESIPSSIWNITDHKVQNYYEGWQRTPHS